MLYDESSSLISTLITFAYWLTNLTGDLDGGFECATKIDVCLWACTDNFQIAQAAIFTIIVFYIKYFVCMFIFPGQAIVLKTKIKFHVTKFKDEGDSDMSQNSEVEGVNV